eukprot:974893-Rhodomonas_salina.1
MVPFMPAFLTVVYCRAQRVAASASETHPCFGAARSASAVSSRVFFFRCGRGWRSADAVAERLAVGARSGAGGGGASG